MTREDTLKAVDEAFKNGIERTYQMFVDGLELDTPINQLAERTRGGIALHCDAHAKLTVIVNDYFKDEKA